MKTLKRFGVGIILLMCFIASTGLYSCARQCYPELIEIHDTIVTRDSVFINHVRDSIVYREVIDSTHIDRHDSIWDRLRGDTVYIKEYHEKIEYRYRLKRDSIYVYVGDSVRQKTDSIASHDSNSVQVKPERYIPPFFKWSTIIFWVLVVLFLLYIAVKIAM